MLFFTPVTCYLSLVTKKASIRMPFLIWGERWDLNPRQPEPQSGALPTELRPPRNRISILVSSLLLVNKIWYARQDSAPPAYRNLLSLLGSSASEIIRLRSASRCLVCCHCSYTSQFPFTGSVAPFKSHTQCSQ